MKSLKIARHCCLGLLPQCLKQKNQNPQVKIYYVCLLNYVWALFQKIPSLPEVILFGFQFIRILALEVMVFLVFK
jgi:hypothetical protein